MIEKIKEYINEAEAFSTQNKEELEAFRIKFLGKKGLLNDFFAEFKNVPNEQKKEFGQVINQLKNAAQTKVDTIAAAIGTAHGQYDNEDVDLELLKKITDKIKIPFVLILNAEVVIVCLRDDKAVFSMLRKFTDPFIIGAEVYRAIHGSSHS